MKSRNSPNSTGTGSGARANTVAGVKLSAQGMGAIDSMSNSRQCSFQPPPVRENESQRPMPLRYIDRMFVHLLNQAGHEVSSDFVRILGERGLTVRQWRVLGALWDVESLTLTELTELTLCGNSTITRLIERLTEQGMVTRRQDRIDRRKTLVSLTSAAKGEVAHLVKLSETLELAAIKTIGPDIVETMMAELRRMVIKLKEARCAERK